jgi:hypothetical protein
LWLVFPSFYCLLSLEHRIFTCPKRPLCGSTVLFWFITCKWHVQISRQTEIIRPTTTTTMTDCCWTIVYIIIIILVVVYLSNSLSGCHMCHVIVRNHCIVNRHHHFQHQGCDRTGNPKYSVLLLMAQGYASRAVLLSTH